MGRSKPEGRVCDTWILLENRVSMRSIALQGPAPSTDVGHRSRTRKNDSGSRESRVRCRCRKGCCSETCIGIL